MTTKSYSKYLKKDSEERNVCGGLQAELKEEAGGIIRQRWMKTRH